MTLRIYTIFFSLIPFSLAAQWTPLTTGLQSIRSMTHLGTDLYAATYPSGVKKSTTGGSSWNAVNNGLPMSGSNIFCESVGYNGAYLFAGTQSGIYRSNNGGTLWEVANGSLTASSTVYANKWFHFSGTTMAVFAGSVAAGGGMWRTSNNGTNWYIGHSGMGSNVTVYHLTPVGSTLYASTSVGIYTSADNGLSWVVHPTVNYATYSIAQVSTTLVMTCTFGYRYSTNGGSTWLDASGDPASPTEGELIAYDGILYANTGTSTGCLRSTDNGMTWSAYNTGLGAIDQTALEEFHVASTKLYVSALFDIYYINGLGLGAPAHDEVNTAAMFPTIFVDGFTYTDPNATHGELQLIDMQGKVVHSIRISSTAQWIDRRGLASGTYRVRLNNTNATLRDLGTVIAQ